MMFDDDVVVVVVVLLMMILNSMCCLFEFVRLSMTIVVEIVVLLHIHSLILISCGGR